MTLNILTYPDKFLRTSAKEVKNIDGNIYQLVTDMTETMYNAPGIGLAAIQVGIDKRIIIYDESSKGSARSIKTIINPKIILQEEEFFI